jgi:hypothetical protein
MKEYLKSQPLAGVSVAVVQEITGENEKNYFVFLINNSSQTLKDCIIASRGYGVEIETQTKIETSTLRHFLDELAQHSYVKIEPIMKEVFGLNNEYWVSFWIDNMIYDKRFIFLPESIEEENMVHIPLMQQKGVLIQ